jgi:putative tricarboxylic transport membrane protein
MSEEGAPPPVERRPERAALVIALGLLALAAVVAWDAAHMRTGVAAYSRIGPRAFPYAVAAGLAILGLITAIAAFRDPQPPPHRDEVRPILWIVGGLVAQIVLLPYAGFSLATGAVFAATARAFGRGPLWFTYPVGAAIALAIWLFFSKGLLLVLPAGPIERLF